MPKDDQGRWTPEAHRAGYSDKQAEAASWLLSDFERSAYPAQEPLITSETARPVAAATTIQRVLTPLGQTQLAHNAPQQARIAAAERMAQKLRAEVPYDIDREWQARQLLKKFAEVSPPDHNLDDGIGR